MSESANGVVPGELVSDQIGAVASDGSVVEERPRLPGRRRIGVLVALVLMPPVVLGLLRTTLFFRLNNGDPFIYVGYSNAFTSHIERFGYTYHSVRFGLIFPLRASLVLGPVAGYFALRYVLYLVAIVPLYAVLRSRGTLPSLLGPVLFVSCPVVAGAILTTHPDTIAVPGITAFVCLLVLSLRADHRRSLLLLGGAGLIAGVTVNANAFAAILITVLVVPYLLLVVRHDSVRRALLAGTVLVAGTLAVSAAGALVYQAMFGDWNVFRTTWNAANEISANNVWKMPGYEWMSTRRYIYAPAMILTFAGVAFVMRRRSAPLGADQRYAFLAGGVAFGFYVLHQFALGSPSMEQAYYFSYLIGPIILVLALALDWHGSLAGLPIPVVLPAPLLIAYVAQLTEIRPFVLYVCVSLLLIAVALRSRTWVASALLVVAIHLTWGASPRFVEPVEGAAFQYEPHYERAFGGFDRDAYNSYVIASQLPSVVPSDDEIVVPLYFWYRTGSALLDSVQATYHWETLTVQRSPEPGLPVIGAGDLDRLKALAGGFVVMLATDASELAAGRGALIDQGFVIDPADEIRLRSGDAVVVVQVVAVRFVPA